MPTDAHQLARSVARLNRRLRQERQSDLTPTQLSVLGAVLKIGPATPSAIAAHERVQPPSITRTLACLVDEGYAIREPHPDDGRQVLVSVSQKGDAVLAEERTRRDLWLGHRLAALTAAERKTLREAAALLERLAQS
ncbi:MarR family transcriptional regulator [Aeromicrobium sp. SMF47]|uniref:MarR family transcriptional regulator n=1 Tax=Aeromicrobium yanjiei TaxID=2662028 RepID=A0A5Q2MFM6_9ACTN|nr:MULTISPECIES: MarR family transcriptional regulator [Aeromicrobium]MRJ75050.1 MarR family transcriptional regulator [Aeromicrobium yanjiei]MRK02894.1 MarR family transcriptional regulator [Aeromicrobium sp. S22]QGG40461.1 MarR family transcriptional regulator [Aeromicrobium yanjiei]